ncbi:MAG: hypothetical protein ACRCTI_13370 [Beijerinckiaceae bacterium]
MSSNAHLNISPKFKRNEQSGPLGHPMRRPSREHLLRREDNDPVRERRILIRDTLISVMGGVSALVPMFIAVQSVMGA